MKPNPKEIASFFSRGVYQFIDPDDIFQKKLKEKISGKYQKPLIVKWGVDPTRPDLHLGHAVVLRKLRQLQDWGCKVVFLVGDFTSLIGDPTGRNKVRPEIEQNEVETNMKTYLEQAGKILRTDKDSFSWIRNSDWFTSPTDLNLPEDYKVNLEIDKKGEKTSAPINPNSFVGKAIVFEKTRMQIGISEQKKVAVITLKNFLWFLKKTTHAKLIERDMFQERLKSGQELYAHELMYPVLQGIDSQIIAQIYGSCDLEVGGSDQVFNMLYGRDTMRISGLSPQSVLSFKLLEGTGGKEKMSKSLDNYIGINESPEEIFGKTMSIPDNLITQYFILCTYTPEEEIKEIENKLEDPENNPRDLKLRLAKEITAIYHGQDKADKAEESFLKIFQKKSVPEDMKTVEVMKGEKLSEILKKEGLVKSKSDFRRLVQEGAVEEVSSEQKISDPEFKIYEETSIKIGKRRFVRIQPK